MISFHEDGRRRWSHVSEKAGFALLITITLLAFLVLLLVSLASLTRVETQVATNNQQVSLARQNALLGLNIALGQLQKYAGPDQSVTARADIGGAAIANPFYTGVWTGRREDTGLPAVSPATPNVWLVSGNETSPLSVPAATALPDPATDPSCVWLVDKTVGSQAALRVNVRKQEIKANNVAGLSGPQTTGHFAYWVGDEGVKAKINVINPWSARSATSTGAPSVPAFTPTSTEDKRQLLVAPRLGIESMTTDGTTPIGSAYDVTGLTDSSANFRRDLGKLIDARQATLLTAFPATTLQNRFHDVTLTSQGLLTDTASGGLRRDLTYEFERTTPALTGSILTGNTPSYAPLTVGAATYYAQKPKWERLRAFYRLADTVSGGALDVIPSDNNVKNGIAPVFVQLRVLFTPSGTRDIAMKFLVSIANPYSVTLNIPAGLKVEFFIYDEPPLGTATKWIQRTPDPAGPTGISAGAPARFLFVPTLQRIKLQYTGAISLPPGRASLFTLAASSSLTGIAGADLVANLQDSFDPSQSITLVDDTAPTKPPLATVDMDGIGAMTVRLSSADGTQVYQTLSKVALATVTTTTSAITYQLQTKTPADMSGSTAKVYDTRTFANYSLRQGTWHRGYYSEGQGFNDNPMTWAVTTPSNVFNADVDDAYWGRSTKTAQGRTEAVLFDVPQRSSVNDPALFSLAQLQHADITAECWEPAYAIGNSWASPYTTGALLVSSRSKSGIPLEYYDLSYLLNRELWDGYFFSAVPQPTGSFSPASATLPNARYKVKPSPSDPFPSEADLKADGYAAARYLKIDGAFNVNSTSKEAWRALFASLRTLSFNGENNLTGPFLRSLHQPGGSNLAGNGTSANAWTGFRNLTDAEIAALASDMVDNQVRARGPFTSLAAFVNRKLVDSPSTLGLSGALQASLDAVVNTGFPATEVVAINAGDKDYVAPSGYADIEHAKGHRATAAPGWLTQADMLQALGPVLSARSDTFIIRSYGDTVNPATGETVANAACEVVVQRVQEPLQPANPAAITAAEYRTPPGSFGRRFCVVSFRWLSTKDI